MNINNLKLIIYENFIKLLAVKLEKDFFAYTHSDKWNFMKYVKNHLWWIMRRKFMKYVKNHLWWIMRRMKEMREFKYILKTNIHLILFIPQITTILFHFISFIPIHFIPYIQKGITIYRLWSQYWINLLIIYIAYFCSALEDSEILTSSIR